MKRNYRSGALEVFGIILMTTYIIALDYISFRVGENTNPFIEHDKILTITMMPVISFPSCQQFNQSRSGFVSVPISTQSVRKEYLQG